MSEFRPITGVVNKMFNAQMTYKQLLQTPQWKAYAKNVRQAKGNACQVCRRSDQPTQVHHLFYNPDLKPWEYSHADVVLVCSLCHRDLHDQLNLFRELVFRHLTPKAFAVLNGALKVGLEKNDPLFFAYAVAEMASSPRSIEAFAKQWKPKE